MRRSWLPTISGDAAPPRYYNRGHDTRFWGLASVVRAAGTRGLLWVVMYGDFRWSLHRTRREAMAERWHLVVMAFRRAAEDTSEYAV